MARYSKEHRAETRAKIVQVASRALREKGFDGVGVAEVMGAVGLTHGGFYAHFSDRQALLEAALADALGQSPANFAKIAQLAADRDDPTVLAERYLADGKIEDIAGGCATAALMSELHRQPAFAGATFADGIRATVTAIESVDGLENKGWAVLAMLAGAKSMMRAISDGPTRQAIRDEVRDAILKMASSKS
jgi:TetR/AcrR family transcriptional regulator, transcriptional repressor for nem operon